MTRLLKFNLKVSGASVSLADRVMTGLSFEGTKRLPSAFVNDFFFFCVSEYQNKM